MMSSKLRIATLSSEVRVFSAVVFTIPFRAATTSSPFMKAGIPTVDTVFCLWSTDLQYSVHRKNKSSVRFIKL